MKNEKGFEIVKPFSGAHLPERRFRQLSGGMP